MFVDASALVAILTEEDDRHILIARLDSSGSRFTSAIAVFETSMALVRKRKYTLAGAEDVLLRFLAGAQIRLIPIGETESRTALVAFERYGKGRHPAGLNMGDCFAYACAKTLGVPLLYKGEDFARTDLAS